MNITLFFIEIIVYFITILLVNKFFKKEGLYVYMCVASILANIQVCMCVESFGITFTLGNVLFASNFLVTDILNEKYGLDAAKKGVKLSILAVVFYIVVTQITLRFIPSENDIIFSSFKDLFTLDFRVCISSIVMFALSNYADVLLYNKLKGMKKWQKNNIATIICNCAENVLFLMCAYIGVFSIDIITEMIITTCLIETIIALCDTPFLYIATRKERV